MEQEMMTRVSNSRKAYNCESIFQPDLLSQSTLFTESKNQSGLLHENDLFSSSASDMLAKNLRLLSKDAPFYESVDKNTLKLEDDEPIESMEEIENLLPDDDELLSGLIDNLAFFCQPNGGDDIDDGIFFTCKAPELVGGSFIDQKAGLNEIFGGEHPSRVLYVRNIDSALEDAVLQPLFERYGDIQTLYTAYKHQGFIVVSYYDTRAAQNAMRALQNKPLRCQKLDIHFPNPKLDETVCLRV